MEVAGTLPYPWPWTGSLDPARLVLLAVGCQRWWVERTTGVQEALTTLADTARAVRDAGGMVVVVRHSRPRGPERRLAHLPHPGGDAWDLMVPVVRGDLLVDAAGMDAFFGSSLDADLRSLDRDQLAIGGLGLESTVYSTMSAANDRGYECLALTDAAAPHDPAVAERAAASITMSGGIFGAVGTAQALRAALRTPHAHPPAGGNGHRSPAQKGVLR